MEKEQLIQLFAATLNIKPEKFEEIVEAEDAETQIKELSKTALKKKFDEGHGKGLSKGTKELVDAIKSELGVDFSGTTGQEMAESLKGAVSEIEGAELTEEAIKNSDVYKAAVAERVKLEQNFNKAVEKKANEKVAAEKEALQKELKAAKKGSIKAKLEVVAEKWLEEEGALLSDDPARRKRQIKEFVNKLDAYDIDEDADGDYLFTKDGNAVNNAQGHNAKVADIFRENDYLFNFNKTKPRTSTGLNPSGGGNPKGKFEHFKGNMPTNEAEMDALRLDRVNGKISREAFKEVEAAYAETQPK